MINLWIVYDSFCVTTDTAKCNSETVYNIYNLVIYQKQKTKKKSL